MYLLQQGRIQCCSRKTTQFAKLFVCVIRQKNGNRKSTKHTHQFVVLRIRRNEEEDDEGKRKRINGNGWLQANVWRKLPIRRDSFESPPTHPTAHTLTQQCSECQCNSNTHIIFSLPDPLWWYFSKNKMLILFLLFMEITNFNYWYVSITSMYRSFIF